MALIEQLVLGVRLGVMSNESSRKTVAITYHRPLLGDEQLLRVDETATRRAPTVCLPRYVCPVTSSAFCRKHGFDGQVFGLGKSAVLHYIV